MQLLAEFDPVVLSGTAQEERKGRGSTMSCLMRFQKAEDAGQLFGLVLALAAAAMLAVV